MTKVLIVEDDPFLQRAYTTVLTMEGYDVSFAPDGLEGLKKARELKPDLVLLDLLMPNMNGFEFMKQYNLKAHPETKVVVFSNIVTPEEIKKAMELGASKYLTKARFTPKDIVTTIKEVLAGGK